MYGTAFQQDEHMLCRNVIRPGMRTVVATQLAWGNPDDPAGTHRRSLALLSLCNVSPSDAVMFHLSDELGPGTITHSGPHAYLDLFNAPNKYVLYVINVLTQCPSGGCRAIASDARGVRTVETRLPQLLG